LWDFCEFNIHFVFRIDHHAPWFVDPTFQQIGRSDTTTSQWIARIGITTSQQIDRIGNTHKLTDFWYIRFHGLLTLMLLVQIIGTYPLLGMDTFCIYPKVQIRSKFSKLHTLSMCTMNVYWFKKKIKINNIPYPYPMGISE